MANAKPVYKWVAIANCHHSGYNLGLRCTLDFGTPERERFATIHLDPIWAILSLRVAMRHPRGAVLCLNQICLIMRY